MVDMCCVPMYMWTDGDAGDVRKGDVKWGVGVGVGKLRWFERKVRGCGLGWSEWERRTCLHAFAQSGRLRLTRALTHSRTR